MAIDQDGGAARRVSMRRILLIMGAAVMLPAAAQATDFTVTDAGDTGAAGQLRAAINSANSAAGVDRILFNVSPTIASSVTVSDSLTLGGTGGAATIAGAGAMLFNGAGSLTGTVGSNITMTNQAAISGSNFAAIGLTGGNWNLTVDGKVNPTAVCGVCTRAGVALTSSSGGTLTVGPTGVIDAGATSGSSNPVGIFAYNPADALGFGGPAVTININGGTVAASGIGGNGIVLLGLGSTVNMTGGTVSGGSFQGIAIRQGTVNMTGGTVTAGGFGIAGQGNFTIGQGAAVTGSIGILTGGYNYIIGGGLIADLGGPFIPNSVTVGGTLTGTGGTAVIFGTNQPDTFTLHPTGVVNGIVDATFGGGDRFQLGGTGSGNLDVSNIGPAAQYQGFETFAKIDGSTWTLTGTNAAVMPWDVNGGTLNVNGTMANSAFTVNSGATLGGTGTIGSATITAGGSLAPGNSIGTIAIAGNLTFVGAGNYIVEVAPASADRTNASGTATLSGTLRAIGTGGNYAVGTRYTVLNATGGVSGTFGTVAITGNFGATRPRVEYDANNVYIVLDQGLITPFLIGGTPNQRATAGAIDAALTNGSTAAPFLALFGLNAVQLPAALDQLSGEAHVSTAGVLADESRYPRDAILGRLRQASYGGNTQMAALTTGGPRAFAANGADVIDSALAYAKSPIVTKAPPMVAPTYDVTFWAQGFGAWGRFETDANAATVRRDLAGFISGVDTRVGGNGRLGVAAGYTSSKNTLDARGRANVDTGHVAGYGGWNFGSFNLRAGGAYAFHTIDTDRLIAFPGFFDRATANYDGHTGQIFGELGYGFVLGSVAVEPFAGAAWVGVKTDAAAERGGLAALNFAGATFETGYTTLGIRAAGMIPVGMDMILIPRGSLAWQHAFDSVTPTAVLAFQAAPVPFVIAGVPIARDALLAEAGLDLAIGRSATLGVSYTGQIASNVQDHAAKGKFSWRF